MKKFVITIFTTITLSFVLIFSVFAWFYNADSIDIVIDGASTEAYYASGKGTKESPYIITKPRHLYNLAWLQNLGHYNDDVTYFELRDDVDMSELKSAIPPIGVESYPFVGSFNGNGHTIKNVSISTIAGTSSNTITKKPTIIDISSFSFGDAMGLFGVIGRTKLNEEEIIGKVTNCYLNNININVNKGKAMIGLIAGRVVGYLEKVGVAFSQILLPKGATSLDKEEFISKYTLIGDYDSSLVKWDNVPGGEGGGYGSSFDVAKFYTRLELIKSNNGVSQYLPSLDESNDLLTLNSQSYAPLTVSDKSNYSGENAKEIPSNENIGYFLGNQNKFYKKNISFTDLKETSDSAKTTYTWESKKTPRVLFKRTGANQTTTSENIVALTDDEMKSLPLGIRSLVPDTNTTVSHNVIRLTQKFEAGEGNDTTKQSQKNNINYYGEEYSNVYLPNNGIWFKPKLEGKLRFVVYTADNGKNFTLYRCKRSNSSLNGQITTIENRTDIMMTKDLPAYILLYFEYDVTKEDLENGYEYVLGNDTKTNGAYFLYLDIGTNGGAQEGTSSNIKNIGFVYFNDSNGVYSDIDSSVAFSISGTAAAEAVIQFIKNAELVVEYYSSDISLEVKAIGTGNTSKKDETIK